MKTTDIIIAKSLKALALLAMLHTGYAYYKYNIFAWHIPAIAALLYSLGESIDQSTESSHE